MGSPAERSPRPSAHVVCLETYRRARQRRGPKILSYLDAPPRTAPTSPFRDSELTERETAHRQQMLRHLTNTSGATLHGFGLGPQSRRPGS